MTISISGPGGPADVVVNPMDSVGDLIVGGSGGTPTKLDIGSAHNILHTDGSTPAWTKIDESDIDFLDVTTGNTSDIKHGFAPRLSGTAGQFLNGEGNWATPSGQASGYTTLAFDSETTVNLVHNFGAYPVIQVVDGTGAVIAPVSIVNNTTNDFTVTFSDPTSGTIIATLGSPQAQSVIVVTDDYTILVSNRIIKCTAQLKTMTLPDASGNTGREFVIDNASPGDIFVDSLGGTIEDELIQEMPANSGMHIYSDGSNWRLY